ncbi:MAG TPA: OsmC family protein [Terriglobales bacterium]
MKASATWTEAERFVGVSDSGHALVVDASDTKLASSPLELVLIGLCGCTASDVVSILRKKREPFTTLNVSAEAERADDFPRVFTPIKLTYTVGGKATRKAVEDAVRLSETKYCSVGQMLSKTATITSEIVLSDAEAD